MKRLLLMAAFTAVVFAQPKTENAKLETRAVNGCWMPRFALSSPLRRIRCGSDIRWRRFPENGPCAGR